MEEYTPKVFLKSILTYIYSKELKFELKNLNFNKKCIKRFGPTNKPMPICFINDPY